MPSSLLTRCVRVAVGALVLSSVVEMPAAQGGRGLFFDVNPTGVLKWIKMQVPWRKTWHQIVPGKFGGSAHTDLLFYDRQNGDAKFFTTDGLGNLSLLKYHTGWRKTWDMIIPGEFGGSSGTDILLYDARNQIARFYSVSGGNLTLLKQHTGWQDWDQIIPIRLGGTYHTDLFFYSRTRGEAKFFRTASGTMTLVRQAQFQRGWDQIVPGFFDGDGYTDLFFYRKVIGDGKFYSLDASANMTLLKSYTTFSPSWDLIVPGSFGGSSQTDLLFYDRSVGWARSAHVHDGVLTIMPRQTIGKTWHRIIPGVFNNQYQSDVLLYDFTQRVRIHAVKCTNTDGSKAARITPAEVQKWVDKANEVYAAAGVQFDFDPQTDWEVRASDVLNRLDLCSNHATQQSCDASKTLATFYAASQPCKIMVYFRWGNTAGPVSNGFSSPTAKYVAMPGFRDTTTTRYYQDPSHQLHGQTVQGIKLLAHELGHYLGLPHSFNGMSYTGFTDPHLAVISYMQTYNKKTLNDMDGDRHRVYDTPPDFHAKYYVMKGWNPADLFQEIRIYSRILNIDFTVNPDRHNVMSYFGICNNYIRLSPDQQREVREWLHEPHRAKLLDSCSIPGLFEPYGSNCRIGMTHTATGNPGLGQSVKYWLSGGPSSQVANLSIGLSRTSWGSIKLPLNLTTFGMPGCNLYTGGVIIVGGTSSAKGATSTTIVVPNNPSLIGANLYSQYLCADPGANVGGMTMTNGLHTRLGG